MGLSTVGSGHQGHSDPDPEHKQLPRRAWKVGCAHACVCACVCMCAWMHLRLHDAKVEQTAPVVSWVSTQVRKDTATPCHGKSGGELSTRRQFFPIKKEKEVGKKSQHG